MMNINLLPWRDELRRKNKKTLLITLVIYVIVFFILAISIYSHLSNRVNHQLKQNMRLQGDVTAARTKANQLKKIIKEKDALISQIQVLKNLKYNRLLVITLLDEITDIVPRGIHLNRMERKKDKVILRGESSSNESIAELIKKIDTSNDLINPTLREVSVDRKGASTVIKFELTFQLVPPKELSSLPI